MHLEDAAEVRIHRRRRRSTARSTPISSRIAGHVVRSADRRSSNLSKQATCWCGWIRRIIEVAVAKAKADLADAVATLASSRTDVPITSVTTNSTLAGANSSRAGCQRGVSGAEQQLGAARARLATAQANVRVAEANYAKAAQDVHALQNAGRQRRNFEAAIRSGGRRRRSGARHAGRAEGAGGRSPAEYLGGRERRSSRRAHASHQADATVAIRHDRSAAGESDRSESAIGGRRKSSSRGPCWSRPS